jgi:peptide/nickel transport system ATP-binding protein
MTTLVARPDSPDVPVLAVQDLSVTFTSEAGPVAAVRNLSYTVRRGEVLGIVGESGSGKSVSSLAIMGLLPEHARVRGSIRFDDQELLGRQDQELSAIRGRRLSMVFQDPLSALTPVYTVGDQIVEALVIHGTLSREAAGERAVELLDLVGIPNPRQRASAFPHEFSGGMRQRAMIAMAIANDPDVIVADEPTTALDVTIQAQVLEVLRKAQAVTGAAIVLITHDMGVIAGLADRVGVMYAGTLVEIGPVADVFARSRMPYTLGLLGSLPRLDTSDGGALTPLDGTPPSLVRLPPGCPFATRCPLAVDACRATEPRLAPTDGTDGHVAACHRSNDIAREGLAGADIFSAPPVPPPAARPSRDASEPVLAVEGLVRHYPVLKGTILRRRVGTVHAVDSISFDIRPGETLGLVGESGCGKTTTIMEILGLERPAGGQVRVFGRDTATLTAADRFAIRRQMQVVFQDPLASLDPRLPVHDIIAEPLRAHGVPLARETVRVTELLALVGLQPEHASRYPQALSGGQRQRVGIARALALEPKLLVLDEPVSALDVSIRAGVINLLERLKHDLDLSYLFVAHDLSVVRHVADRVAVMYLGRLVETGTTDDVFDHPAHPYTQALLSAIPLPDPARERARHRIVLEGDLPSPVDPPSGCRFRTRCPKFANTLSDAERRQCINVPPDLTPTTGTHVADHADACHYGEPLAVL